MSAQLLTRTLLEEADLIDALLELVVEQREAIKSGNHTGMQDLMKSIQEVFFRIQAQEAHRARVASETAKAWGCEPRLSALLSAAPEEERALFRGAGERLNHTVFSLKAEMAILKNLIEQNESFSAMLLSEWRRLDAGFLRAGGLDFRG